jgi:hypothetical protein
MFLKFALTVVMFVANLRSELVMPRLSPISRSDLIKGLRTLGWDGPISGRKHQHMVKGDRQLTIPNPHRGDIGANLLKIVLNEAGISRNEWIRRR